MKRTKHITSLLVIAGLMAFASTVKAQVTASATITLTVIPAPGLNFVPARVERSSSSAVVSSTSTLSGITFQSSSNIMVQLNSSAGESKTDFHFQQGDVKTITSKDLSGVKSIEVVYLGS